MDFREDFHAPFHYVHRSVENWLVSGNSEGPDCVNVRTKGAAYVDRNLYAIIVFGSLAEEGLSGISTLVFGRWTGCRSNDDLDGQA